jgi:hypothetical protein
VQYLFEKRGGNTKISDSLNTQIYIFNTQVKKTEVATVLQNLYTLYLRVPEYWTQTTCTLCTSLLAGQHVSRLANTDSQSETKEDGRRKVINGKNENANFKMTHNILEFSIIAHIIY